MKIGISGANGHVGRVVVEDLRRRAEGHEIVAITRTPENTSGGVKARMGDYDKPESLAAAYSGIDRLLLIPSPDLSPDVMATQMSAAIDAAAAAGVEHVLLLSGAGARKKSRPAKGVDYWTAENRLIRSNMAAWTILRMNFFAETFIEVAQMALGMQMITGLAENRVAFVSRDDVGLALAGALAGEGKAGITYNLTGPASVSGTERAALIAQASGKPFSFAILTADQLRGGMAQTGLPDFLVDAFVAMEEAFVDGAYDIVTSDVEKLSGRAPRPLGDVVRQAFA